MAKAPKPWLNDPDWPARQRARAAARRASWPPAENAADAGLRALQPHGGESHRVLVFIRCAGHRGRGPTLAWVCATEDGPVFWSVSTWMTHERYSSEGALLQRLPRPGEHKRRPHRSDVFDLLEFAGPHPELEVRCRRCPPRNDSPITLDRELVMERVRASLRASRPLTLWVHPSSHSV